MSVESITLILVFNRQARYFNILNYNFKFLLFVNYHNTFRKINGKVLGYLVRLILRDCIVGSPGYSLIMSLFNSSAMEMRDLL